LPDKPNIMDKLIIDCITVQSLKDFNIARGMASEQGVYGCIYNLYCHEISEDSHNENDIVSINFPAHSLSKRAILAILIEYFNKFPTLNNYAIRLCNNDIKQNRFDSIRLFLEQLSVFQKKMLVICDYKDFTSARSLSKFGAIVQPHDNINIGLSFSGSPDAADIYKTVKLLKEGFFREICLMNPIIHDNIKAIERFLDIGFNKICVSHKMINKLTQKS